jgi:hypothetical protein
MQSMELDPFAVVVGYVYAIGGGRAFVPWAMGAMVESHEVRERAAQAAARGEPEVWHREAFGMVEAAAIATGVIVGYPQLIAVWLVFKAAVAWGGWKDQAGTFNRYAVGTVLSIMFGAAGGTLALVLPGGDPWAIGIAFGPPLLAGLVRSFYRGPQWWRRLLGGS